MKETARKTLETVGGLGALTGMRSMAPAALLARQANGSRRWRWRRAPASERIARSGRVAGALTLMALGEVVLDKLPGMPARTEPAPLLGRALFGGLLGATVADLLGTARALPALIGAGAAVAGAELAYRVRAGLGRTGIPDFALGVVEDAVVLAAGRALVADLD